MDAACFIDTVAVKIYKNSRFLQTFNTRSLKSRSIASFSLSLLKLKHLKLLKTPGTKKKTVYFERNEKKKTSRRNVLNYGILLQKNLVTK